jgi:hypothetical protein
MLLEPAPDGSHAYPRPDAPPVPIAIDLDGTPFELISLALGPRGALRVALGHTGSEPVTAWAVSLRTVSSDGAPLGGVRRTQDWSFTTDAERARRFRATGMVPPEHGEGAFYPGQTGRIELAPTLLSTGDPRAAGQRLVLSVPLVVFEDTSFLGDATSARAILADRTAGAEEKAYWIDRINDLIRGADSDAALARGIEALLARLDEPPDAMPPRARAVRSNLRTNLEGTLRKAKTDGGRATADAEDLVRWMSYDLERWLAHVPAELPRPEDAGDRLSERVYGEDSGEGNGDGSVCECGGETQALSTTSTIFRCTDSSHSITITESWTFQCTNDEGQSISSPAPGTLIGRGGCVEDLFCIPDRYCPPTFLAAVTAVDGGLRTWQRDVIHAQVAVSPCTSRCTVGTGDSLTSQCLCDPRPAPGCSVDGCPVLIETGAGGFDLTDLDGGVLFDLDGDGTPNRVSWTAPDGDDAWLALDRNGNGLIDDGTELFGDKTDQPPSDEPNGFLALAVFDASEHGGDEDGRISADDRIFGDLLLWIDRDHDGFSQPDELTPLVETDVTAIELGYFRSARRDEHGNDFRYSSRIWLASGGHRLATDVFLHYE